jgi:hypothetical protein
VHVNSWLLPLVAAACIAVPTALAVGRGGSGFSGCGWAYEFTVAHTTITAGGCAGILPRDPIRMTMRVHQRLVVHIAYELSSGRLDYPVPTSTSAKLRFLGRHRAVARYLATHAGRATLLAEHTPFCQATDPRIATCVVLKLRIIA